LVFPRLSLRISQNFSLYRVWGSLKTSFHWIWNS